MKKSLLFLSIIFSLALGIFASRDVKAAVAADPWSKDPVSGDYHYTVTGASTATITHYDGSDAELTIPDKLGNYYVTAIASQCFSNNSTLTRVTIPEGVTTVAGNAFIDCDSLSYVKFSTTVKSIGFGNPIVRCNQGEAIYVDMDGNSSFKVVNSMLLDSKGIILFGYYGNGGTVSIQDSVRAIRTMAFCGTNVTKVEATENTKNYSKYICSYAFMDCKRLSEVYFGNTKVYEIHTGAFYGCTNLVKCPIYPGIISIGANAFYGTQILKDKLAAGSGYVALGDGSNDYAIIDVSKVNGTLTIPQGIKVLAMDMLAFSVNKVSVPSSLISYGNLINGNLTIKSVVLNEGITTIPEKIFLNAKGLTSISFPASITTIKAQAFSGCTALKNLYFPNYIKNVDANAFANWSGKIHCYSFDPIGKMTLPSTITKVFYDSVGTPAMDLIKSYETGVWFQWKAVSDAADYVVYRKEGNGSYVKIGTATGLKYIDKTAVSGKTYTYTVKAHRVNRVSTYGAANLKGLSIKYLAAPQVKLANSSAGGVIVSYKAVPGADSYRIYRYDDAKKIWVYLATNTGVKTYFDKSLESGKKYKYTVKSMSGSVVGSYLTAGAGITYVSAPKVSSLSNTEKGIIVKFNKVTGAAKYYIYRKENSGSYKYIATTTANSYVDTTAQSGISYKYTVRASAADGSISAFVDSALIMRLAAPQVKLANSSAGGVIVSYNAVPGADSYRIYRYDDTRKIWIYLATNTGVKTYFDKSLETGKKYKYTVKSMRGSVVGSYLTAGAVITYVSAPKVSSLSNTEKGIIVKFNKVTVAAKYYIYRKENSGSYKYIATTTANSYVDTTAQSGISYKYTVRASAADGSISAFVDSALIMRLAAPQVKLANSAAGGITISYNAVPGADSYRIYRYDDTRKIWVYLATNTGVKTYFDKSLENGKKYKYTVKSMSGSVVGSYLTAGASITYVSAPKISSMDISENGITIKFNKITGATKYRVYRKENGGNYSCITETTSNSYDDVLASSGKYYKYTVRACAADGSWSGYVDSALINYLAAPVVTWTGTSDSVTLAWNPIEGAAGYVVYRSENNGSFAKIKTISNADTVIYTDNTISSSVAYKYRVRAYCGTVYSGYTDISIGGFLDSFFWQKNASPTYIYAHIVTTSNVDGYELKYTRTVSGTVVETKIIDIGKPENNEYKIMSPASGTYVGWLRSYITVNGTKEYSEWVRYTRNEPTVE